MILINSERITEYDEQYLNTKDLVHPGQWLGDGNIRVRLGLRIFKNVSVSGTSNYSHNIDTAKYDKNVVKIIPFDVFNFHFSGGIFGKSTEVIEKKRGHRRDEFSCLQKKVEELINEKDSKSQLIIVAGDSNCDTDQPELSPESRQSLEFQQLALPSPAISDANSVTNKNDRLQQQSVGAKFIDATKGLGATESASKNLFRKWLKPNQNREVRFDKILVTRGSSMDYSVEVIEGSLVGDTLITMAGLDCKLPPLFPSDHFGCDVKFSITPNCPFPNFSNT